MDFAEHSIKSRQTVNHQLVDHALDHLLGWRFFGWPRNEDFIDAVYDPVSVDSNVARAPSRLRRQIDQLPAVHRNRDHSMVRGHWHTIGELKNHILTSSRREQK